MTEEETSGAPLGGGCLVWGLLCLVSGVHIGTLFGGGVVLLGLASLARETDTTFEDVAWVMALGVAIGFLLA